MILVASPSFAPIILICLHLFSGFGAHGEVLLTPANYNASEGSGGVIFTCTVSVSLPIFFLVDDGQLDNSLQQSRGISTEIVNSSVSMLIIQPLPVNNNTTVVCFSLMGQLIVFSPPVLLLVQGRLSAPPALNIMESTSPSYRLLSWTPPFTLDLTDKDPDIIGYRVCFSSSAVPGALEASLQCVVRQEAYYSFLNVRISLQFSVTALNVVGDGNSSVITHQACTAGMSLCHL